MKKKLFSMGLISILIAMYLAMATSMVVFADSAAVQAQVQNAVNTTGSIPAGAASYLGTAATATATQSISITINGATTIYWYDPANEAAILSACSGVQSGAAVDQALNTFTMKADVGGAAGLMSGFQKPLEVFLGILVTLITIGMTVFTAFDLCYIAFPVFRGKMDEAKANGTKGITKTGKGGETKLTIVTEDAQYAVTAADMANSGENPFLLYFKKRVVSFVVLAVLLFVLITGKINILANIGVKLADGLLNMINGSF